MTWSTRLPRTLRSLAPGFRARHRRVGLRGRGRRQRFAAPSRRELACAVPRPPAHRTARPCVALAGARRQSGRRDGRRRAHRIAHRRGADGFAGSARTRAARSTSHGASGDRNPRMAPGPGCAHARRRGRLRPGDRRSPAGRDAMGSGRLPVVRDQRVGCVVVARLVRTDRREQRTVPDRATCGRSWAGSTSSSPRRGVES